MSGIMQSGKQYKDQLEFIAELALSGLHAKFDYNSNTITLSPLFDKPLIKLAISIVEDGFKVAKLIYESNDVQLTYDDKMKNITLNLNTDMKLTLSLSKSNMGLLLSHIDLEFFSNTPATAIASFFARLLSGDTEIIAKLYDVASEADKQIHKY